MVIHGIKLVSLLEELHTEEPGLLSPFYADDAAFDRSEKRSVQLLKLLMEWGMDPGYFHELARLLFIYDTPEQEE